MTSTTPAACVPGKSTSAPEERGGRGTPPSCCVATRGRHGASNPWLSHGKTPKRRYGVSCPSWDDVLHDAQPAEGRACAMDSFLINAQAQQIHTQRRKDILKRYAAGKALFGSYPW